MARIIKYENSIGNRMDSPKDPANNETMSETIRRLKQTVKTLGLVIRNIQETWAKDQKTSMKLMELSEKKYKAEQDLKSYED